METELTSAIALGGFGEARVRIGFYLRLASSQAYALSSDYVGL